MRTVTFSELSEMSTFLPKYQVVFLSNPSDPIAGSNSTLLNFSILESNNNIYNTYVALTITEKRSGSIADQLPYKFYEFSDITIPYTFPTPGDYLVTLPNKDNGRREVPSRASCCELRRFSRRSKPVNNAWRIDAVPCHNCWVSHCMHCSISPFQTKARSRKNLIALGVQSGWPDILMKITS